MWEENGKEEDEELYGIFIVLTYFTWEKKFWSCVIIIKLIVGVFGSYMDEKCPICEILGGKWKIEKKIEVSINNFMKICLLTPKTFCMHVQCLEKDTN